MKNTMLTRRVIASPLAPVSVFPYRLATVARHNAGQLRKSAGWLLGSREHANYTYDLEPLNLEHLAWLIANTAGCPVDAARGYLAEVEGDTQLRRVVGEGARRSSRSATTDRAARYGRRVGWYAFVRALQPEFVVETGTNRGLGSVVIAAALLKNGHGTLATVDLDDRSGELIRPPYDKVVEQAVGDSLDFLAGPVVRSRPIDLFVTDTGFTADHERAELEAVAPLLAPDAVVVAPRATIWPELSSWSERQQRAFLYFSEKPRDHWYPGAGIGVSFPEPAKA